MVMIVNSKLWPLGLHSEHQEACFLKQEWGAEWGYPTNNSSRLLIVWYVRLSAADK